MHRYNALEHHSLPKPHHHPIAKVPSKPHHHSTSTPSATSSAKETAVAFSKRWYALKQKLWWLNIGLLVVWIVLIVSARCLFFYEFPYVMSLLLIFLPVVAVAYHIYYDYQRRHHISSEADEIQRLQDRSQRDESNRYNMGIATFSFAILITSVFTSNRLDKVVEKAHQIIIIVLLLTSLIFISGVPGIAHYMVFNDEDVRQLLVIEHISYVSMTFGFCMYLGACFYAIYCLFYYHLQK